MVKTARPARGGKFGKNSRIYANATCPGWETPFTPQPTLMTTNIINARKKAHGPHYYIYNNNIIFAGDRVGRRTGGGAASSKTGIVERHQGRREGVEQGGVKEWYAIHRALLGENPIV